MTDELDALIDREAKRTKTVPIPGSANDPRSPVLSYAGIAHLLGFKSYDAARNWARKNLVGARLECFGTKRARYSRAKVLAMLGLSDSV